MPAVERKTEHVKILQDLGYDPWEIENDDDMLRALKEAINDLSNVNPSDGRIPMLHAAVKGLRKPKFKEKKTTIKGDKFMGKETKNPAPITDKSKLLPGAGFEPTDLKDDEDLDEAKIDEDGSKVDDIIKFLNGEVKDKINEIGSSVKEIEGVIQAQGDLAAERDDDMRTALLAARKRKREDKLESKPQGGGIKDKMLDQVKKPVGSFLGKLIKFLTTVFVGSIVNRVISLLKNPAKLLDPIKQFFNVIISTMNMIMKASWHITAGPINWIIDGINSGVKSLLETINNVTSKFKLPALKAPEIPKIPGPVQFPMIPLAGASGQEAADVQGAEEGGTVVNAEDISAKEGGEVTKDSGIKVEGMGEDTQLLAAKPGEQVVTPEGVKKQEEETGTQPIDFNEGPNANQPTVSNTNNITAASTGGEVGKTVQPRTPLTPKITRMNVGGIVPAPYDASNSFGFGDTYNQNVISPAPQNIMGYNKGGDVTSNNTSNKNITSNNISNNTSNKNITSNTSNVSNKTDSVDAKLTPGEIVMNQVQQQNMIEKTGVDPASFVPSPQPGKVKFATGGVVAPEIGTPNKKSSVVVVGGGGGSKAPRGVPSSGSSGSGTPKFSSVDPNNVNMAVIKSIYNIMN